MTHRTRSILVLLALAAILAACSTTIGAPASPDAPPSQPATPSVQPSAEPTVEPTAEPTAEPTVQPSVEPSAPVQEERVVDGWITVYPGAFSGPGGTIAEAIAAGPSGEWPTLVNGVLFRDTDGRIYLASALSDETVPTFEGPMLEVLEMANDDDTWNMEYAELTNLEEVNGIRFFREAQVLGMLELP